MPRRSTRAKPAEGGDVETESPAPRGRRSTRAAVTKAAGETPEPPAEKPTRASSRSSARQEATPVKSSPRQARGKGKGRGKSPRQKEEDSVSEDEEEEDTTEQGEAEANDDGDAEAVQEVATPSKRGKSPRGGRGRGRGGRGRGGRKSRGGRKKAATPTDSEDEEEIIDADVEAETTQSAPAVPQQTTPVTSPKRGKRSSPRASAPATSPTTSPSRRSSRGAAKAASELIKDVAANEMEDVQEAEDSSRGTKRKADEEEMSSEESKKQKTSTEESESAGDMDTEKEAEPESMEVQDTPETEKKDDGNEDKVPAPMENDTKDVDSEATEMQETTESKPTKVVDSGEKETAASEVNAEKEVQQESQPADSTKEVDQPSEESSTQQEPSTEVPTSSNEPMIQDEVDTKVPETTPMIQDEVDTKVPESTPMIQNEVDTNVPEPTPMIQDEDDTKVPETTPSSDVTSEQPVQSSTETNESEAKVEPVAEAASDEPEPAKNEKPATEEIEKNVEDEPSEISTNAVQSTPSETNDNNKDISEDFIVVNKDQVPAHDSAEVQESLPKTQPDSQSKSEKEETVPVESSVNSAENVNHTAQSSAPNGKVHEENPNPNVLTTRKYVASKDCQMYTEVEKHFTVASYNILATCHAVNGFNRGTEYEWTSAEKLTLEARHSLLMKELQYLAADVICLQEVTPSYFDATLVPALRELGYEGNIKKRLGDLDEGEATFYRTSRFELVESIGHGLRDLIFKDVEGLNEDIKAPVRSVLMESSQSVVLLTKLKCKHTGSSLTVGNVHVSWGRLQAPDIQCLEVCAAVKELVSMAGGVLQPHLICGDFNSPPLTPAYQVVSDGYLDDRNMAILQSLTKVQLAESKDALVNLLWKGFQHTANSLKSVYKHITGDEPFSSNFPHDKTLRAVDYQWFSSNTVVGLGVLAAVDPNLIKSGIPNEIFPSDHLSTKARYSFK